MKNLKIFLLVWIILLSIAACEKGDVREPLDKDTTPPKAVSNPQVENLPGAAKITYTLPDNKNLLYVKAIYKIKKGIQEVRASVYVNNLLVEGFGDTDEHEVELYAVSRAEVASEPIKVKVKPLTPPVLSVFATLNVIETFGGINVKFLNPSTANIIVGVLVRDEQNFWKDIDFYYTSQATAEFNTRGFVQPPPPAAQKEYTFGLYVKDRWDNYSDTLITKKTPIYEEELDKSKFVYVKGQYPIPQQPPLPLSGAAVKEPGNLSSWPFSQMFDAKTTGNGFHTTEKQDQPIWIPWDLGVKAKLSRFKLWQRLGTSFTFNHGNPHQWEIWGTNTPSDVNSWVKLFETTMVKPSGLPVGLLSNEDVQVATEGQEYDFPAGLPAVRYIAWKNIDSWSSIGGSLGFMHLIELSFWGQKQ